MTMPRAQADSFEHAQGRRPTLPERMISPSQRVSGPADLANADQFESLKHGEAEWVHFFDERPDVLHAILGDIYVATVYDERKRATGQRLDGRRVMPRDANLAALETMITPRYSMDVFDVAVRELMGEKSLRQFASRVPMDHRELSRMMRGETRLTMYALERIAASARVTPHFFQEYRVLFIAAALERVFTTRPNLSVGVIKKLGAIQ